MGHGKKKLAHARTLRLRATVARARPHRPAEARHEAVPTVSPARPFFAWKVSEEMERAMRHFANRAREKRRERREGLLQPGTFAICLSVLHLLPLLLLAPTV